MGEGTRDALTGKSGGINQSSPPQELRKPEAGLFDKIKTEAEERERPTHSPSFVANLVLHGCRTGKILFFPFAKDANVEQGHGGCLARPGAGSMRGL